ncbi:MAG: hypothetical protein M3014_03945 [Chloroflexota bacterium]|nr:hypothetical protein [Chloroflexota bacterium]
MDHEATLAEREQVDLHVASCDDCACKLTEYMEMAAIFAEQPFRAPEPQLRAGLWRQIGASKEELSHRQAFTSGWTKPNRVAPPSVRSSRPQARVAAFLWRAASPLAVSGVAVFALMLLVIYNTHPLPSTDPSNRGITSIYPVEVPTIQATFVYGSSQKANASVPQPIETNIARVPGSASPLPIGTSKRATATLSLASVFKLAQPTPVLEPTTVWHSLRDATYGYLVSYPPNWWTTVQGNRRTFYPWSAAGTTYAPYWIDLQVDENTQGYTAETYNRAMFGGTYTTIPSASGSICLRHSTLNDGTSNDPNFNDELYGFDARHIYLLRLSVPKKSISENSITGNLDTPWSEAEKVFTLMGSRLSMQSSAATDETGFDRVLFLNGGDLWSVRSGGSDSRPVYRGYGSRWVLQFAQSSDLQHVAFAATDSDSSSNGWAKKLYLTRSGGQSPADATLLWSGDEVHDLAWYGDHQLLFIAKDSSLGLGLFSFTLESRAGGPMVPSSPEPRLLVKFGDDLAAARDLAVSPDRQLITFLAPLGSKQGTDIYAVRPDGSDLHLLISHESPAAPTVSGTLLLKPEDQAVKDYVWAGGSLENNGYAGNLLFTCGNSESPSLYKGGFLFSSQTAARASMIAPAQLKVPSANSVQIVHIAYSSAATAVGAGKVAVTGFYMDRDDRAELLAGLWTADLIKGALVNIKQQPLPAAPDGIADLQWSADGKSLFYRETIPTDQSSAISHYDGRSLSHFQMMSLGLATGKSTVLFDNNR